MALRAPHADKGGVGPPELCKIGHEQSDMPVVTLGLPRASSSIVDLIDSTPGNYTSYLTTRQTNPLNT